MLAKKRIMTIWKRSMLMMVSKRNYKHRSPFIFAIDSPSEVIPKKISPLNSLSNNNTIITKKFHLLKLNQHENNNQIEMHYSTITSKFVMIVLNVFVQKKLMGKQKNER